MLSALTAAGVRLWLSTLRVSTLYRGVAARGEEWRCDREIYAVAERDLLAVLPFTREHRFLVMIALGRDGDKATAIAERLGCSVVRGSSLRAGGEAAVAFAKVLETWDGPAMISVDGPLGPAGVVKPGIALLAAASARPILVVSAAAHRSWRVPGTWAGIEIPLPFTRIVVAGSDRAPMRLPLDRPRLEDEARSLEDEMLALRSLAAATVSGRERGRFPGSRAERVL